MKIIKKISAIVASALMVGCTMGVAAAANYPAPFVVGGSADAAIVVGTGAGVSPLDGLQAGAINLNLNSYATGTSSGGSSTASGSGGDFKLLSTSARNLYYNDSINAALPTLTSSELPTVLAAGNFNDLSGTQYAYTQTLKVGNARIIYGTSQGDMTDPKMYVDTGNYVLSSGYMYNYTLTFSKNVNVSDATNVIGQPITMMGQTYVIGSSSTNSTLYLNGAGQSIILSSTGTPTTVTLGGVAHTVSLTAATATNTATITVDGISKSVTQGSTYTFTGNLNVYVKTITYQGYAGGVQSVELLVGSSSLKLTQGQTVKTGASYSTSLQGTSVNIAGVSGNLISGFSVTVAANATQSDYITAGQTFIDPVFGQSVKITFVGTNPDITSPARGMLEFTADTGTNPQYEYLTFTSARAGASGAQKLTVVYDNNTATTAIAPVLAHQTVLTSVTPNRGYIHVLEGEYAALNDWYVINQGDFGTIVSVDAMSVDSTTSGSVTFRDVITGQTQVVTLTNSTGEYANSATSLFGGTGYNVHLSTNGTIPTPSYELPNGVTATTGQTVVAINWNSGTTALYPRIKLATGGWIALLGESVVANGTNLLLPNGKSTLDTSGQAYTLTAGGTTIQQTVDTDGIQWIYENVTTAGTMNYTRFWGINTTTVAGAATICNFSYLRGPAVLIMEPKKYSDSSYGDFVCIPQSGSASTALTITDAQFNGTLITDSGNFITLGSNTYQKQALDKYGTFVTENNPTSGNGDVTVYVPASQMYFDVAFASPSTTVTAGAGSAVAGASIGNIVVLDSQVSSVQGHNLIVVGGSCINSVAANLLGGAYCSGDWTTNTGVGANQFLIQSFGGVYTPNKVAVLVAGYNAQDTVNAATYLINKAPDVSTGKKWIGTDANTAQLQVASS